MSSPVLLYLQKDRLHHVGRDLSRNIEWKEDGQSNIVVEALGIYSKVLAQVEEASISNVGPIEEGQAADLVRMFLRWVERPILTGTAAKGREQGDSLACARVSLSLSRSTGVRYRSTTVVRCPPCMQRRISP